MDVGRPFFPENATATCTTGANRIIDWGLASNSMSALVRKVTTIDDAPVRPHFPVVWQLAAKPRQVMVQTIVKPHTIPQSSKYNVPPSWQFVRDMARTKANSTTPKPIPQIVQDYATKIQNTSWSSYTGSRYRELCLALDYYSCHCADIDPGDQVAFESYLGRGEAPQLTWQPATPFRVPGDVDSSANASCWVMLLHQVHALRALDEVEHWRQRQNLSQLIAAFKPTNVPESLTAASDDICRTLPYIHRLNRTAVGKLYDKVVTLHHKIEECAKRDKRTSFHLWLSNSLAKGGGEAHRYTRGHGKAPPLPGSVYDEATNTWLYHPQEKAEYWAKMWDKVWGTRDHALPQLYASLIQCIQDSCASSLDPLDAQDVHAAIKLINSNTALGVDFLDIAWLKRLPIEACADIADILNEVEVSGAWPIQTLTNIIVLMGKPTGGVRPIALMPIIYRIWCRARRHTLIDWETHTQGHWDAAVRGNSALRAALVGAIFDETSNALRHFNATILWDMEKFMTTLTSSSS